MMEAANSWINTDIKDLIKQIEEIDFNTESISEIQRKVEAISNRNIVCPTTFLPNPKQKYIFRSRPVDDFSKIKSINDLTYPPPSIRGDTWGRAAMPGDSMFYGTTGFPQTDGNFKPFILGTLLETLDCFKSEFPINGAYKAVTGAWEIKQNTPLKLFTVINPYAAENRTPIHKEFAKRLEEELDVYENQGLISKENGKALQYFLYKQFGKKVKSGIEYSVPAVYTNILLNSSMKQDTGFDGVIYESVQCAEWNLDQVTCVSLMPDSVDKKLELKGVLDMVVNVVDGNIEITFDIHKDAITLCD